MRYFVKVDESGNCLFTTSSPKPTNTEGLIEVAEKEFLEAPFKRLVAGKWEARPAPAPVTTIEDRLAAIETQLGKLAAIESKLDSIKTDTAKVG